MRPLVLVLLGGLCALLWLAPPVPTGFNGLLVGLGLLGMLLVMNRGQE
jgi:hypothetical protein